MNPLYFVFILAVMIVAILDYLYEGRGDAEAQPPHSMRPTSDRRIDARRANEAIKLSATLANNLAVGIIVAGLIGPAAANREVDPAWYSGLILVAGLLHLLGRYLLSWLKSED